MFSTFSSAPKVRSLVVGAAAPARTLARRGFTLIELLVVIAVIALLVSILLPALTDAKRAGKQTINLSNLRQYGATLQSYSTDFKELNPAFTWKANVTYYSLQPNGSLASYIAGNDVDAANRQAIDIIKRRSSPENTLINQQPATGWIPHIFYTHLVMLDYLAARLPEPITRSPFDFRRQLWAEGPADQGYLNSLGLNQATDYRWPYSSSYHITACSFAPDKETTDGGQLRQYAGMGNSHRWYFYNQGTSNLYRLSGRKISDARFPAQKVFAYTDQARHRSKNVKFYLKRDAEVAAVFYDASVRVQPTYDFNKGGYMLPSGTATTAWVHYDAYDPIHSYDDPVIMPSQRAGRLRWTLGGLKGVDIGTKEPFVNNTAE